jgi:hypothetical protein
MMNSIILYSSPNIRMIKSRRMKWAWHAARMREMTNLYKIAVGKSERETTRKTLASMGG